MGLAEIRTSRPARISGHPSNWGSVGLPKRVANHSATRGSKPDSTSPFYGSQKPLSYVRGSVRVAAPRGAANVEERFPGNGESYCAVVNTVVAGGRPSDVAVT